MTYSFKCPYCGAEDGVRYRRRASITEVACDFTEDGQAIDADILEDYTLKLEASCDSCCHPLCDAEIQDNLEPNHDE